ncbi:MAG: T9SS C-terminal target domain-containing protein, partial [Nitrosomonadales bacterium]|nr:T9SS C-terminal target domain-containing protein [Nitrosomonadales bacterium]
AHDGATISGDQVNQHNFGYIDAAIANTTASIQQWSDGEGYNLEWKVPFASLAGKIASSTGSYSDFEWPSFTPEDGLIFSFDVEVGDADEVANEMSTEYLRLGTSSNLANYSSRFGFRGKIVDMNNNPMNTPRWTYPIDYKSEQNVELDADLSDWNDAYFWGMNQDHPLFTEIQGIPQSPEDFSGYFAMKMDDQNLYVAVRVRDEGTPMIQTLDTPNLAFNYDHVSVYLGLYDISDIASNPHVEGPGEFYMFRERFAGTDTIISNRTYRIRPEIDNTSSTRGADYQMLLRALPYGPEPVEPEEYNGAYVDTMIYKGTEAAADYTLDEQGYIMEWKVPFESLAGEISKGQKPLPGNYRGIEWPLFSPENGVTISFDADLTDRDERDGARGMNRFLRMGDLPALWRDSKSFKMRGHIVETRAKVGVSIDEDLTQNIRPYDVYLSQNYPNPFNPSTQIEFYLPYAGELSLEVYNLLGQKVATVTNGLYSSGTHSVTFDASALSSGVYVYTLKSGQHMHSRKFTLIK